MKLFLGLLLVAALQVSAAAQEAPRTKGAPLVVEGFRWYKFAPGWDRASDIKYEREPTLAGPVNINRPRVNVRTQKPSPGYKYRVKVKNAGRKAVRAVVWEYRFTEIGSGVVHTRRFRTVGRIKAGESKELEAFTHEPPSRTVDISSLEKKRRDPFEEQVVVASVEYADGTTWRAP
ncbi:MAG TPA: hypothetical protein VGV38_17680 [Pyrinomonadaceae bacterium]|nr:hypothetical protein [Pyrinomonadaceae bacterium]